MLEELARKHRVYGSLIPEAKFEIVEVLGTLAPWAALEPPGARPTIEGG